MNTALRSWLRRHPQPVKCMLDGDPKRIVDVPQGRGKWMDLMATLEAVDAWETITLLDANGAVIRARKCDAEEQAEETADGVQEVMDESKFPIAALGEQFRLLVKDAMDALVQCAREASTRANTAEEAYAKAVVARADAEATLIRAQNDAQPEQSQTSQLLGHFLGGATAAQKGPSNGTT